jgi:putative ABC transport system ATP-binding protein
MELMKELHDEGATICMVTHDPRYSAVAERSVQLFDGQVVDETDAERAASVGGPVESGFEG